MKRRKSQTLMALLALALCLSGCGGKGSSDVDLDLTRMSSTMVYSEVFNMLYEPEDYIGKTVRMDGICAAYHSQISNTDYWACIIEDATACCSQGIEFVLAGDAPSEDYPPDGKEIELVGTFEVFMDGEYEICRLANAKLL